MTDNLHSPISNFKTFKRTYFEQESNTLVPRETTNETMPAQQSRTAEALVKIPLITLVFASICVATYGFQLLLNPNIHQYTMNPRQVIQLNEYYRIITSAFLHGNLFHIGMNMVTFMSIGKELEKCFGTLWTAVTIMWSVFLTGSFFVCIAFLGHMVGYDKFWNQHSLGFSGVLFHLLVIQCGRNPDASQSVFGVTTISSKFYPWLLLVAIQILMPNISFLGHLSGILCGNLQTEGMMKTIIPSADYLRLCDDSQRLRFMSTKPNYVRTPSSESFAMFTRRSTGLSDGQSIVSSVFGTVLKFVRDVLQTIEVIIFGRRPTTNVDDEVPGPSLEMGLIPTESAPLPSKEVHKESCIV